MFSNQTLALMFVVFAFIGIASVAIDSVKALIKPRLYGQSAKAFCLLKAYNLFCLYLALSVAEFGISSLLQFW